MTMPSSATKNTDCPFCGCKVDPEGWLRGDGARGPECVGCGATAPSLQMWNSRVQPSALPLGATAEGDDADRAAFRAAYSQQVRVTQAAFMTNADGSFVLPIVDMSWRMWQASATRLVTGGRQAEPVTLPSCKAKLNMSHDWDQGYSSGWKDCCEETTKLGPLYTRPVQSEPVAWDVAARIADIPGVHEALKLFSEDPTGDAGTSLVREVLQATHAEPNVVERLKAELANLRKLHDSTCAQLAEAREDRNKLGDRYDAAEAKLAELRSALEGMVEYFPEGHSDGECFSVEKAKAALSASAASEVKP